MTEYTSIPAAGAEPGLRFACVLNGKGGCDTLDWRGVEQWQPDDGFLWIHLERDTAEAAAWISGPAGLEPIVAEALIAEDSRPTIEAFEHGLFLVLRGVNIAEGEGMDGVGGEPDLVPIHIWIDQSRAITLRDKDHALSALRDIRIALQAARGPRTAGGLLVQISEKIVRDLGPSVDRIDEAVELLEERATATRERGIRRALAEIRRRAVHLRRYLGPEREALLRLQTEDTPLLDKRDRLRLRCVIDSLIRYLEDLDALRDRTTILHEEMAALTSERIAQTSNRLTAVAALLLPPSLVAGMLGANIGGIPGRESPIAFWELSILIVVMLVIQALILRRIRWL
jgi:zinc transporter